METDDALLIQRVKEGDAEAFNTDAFEQLWSLVDELLESDASQAPLPAADPRWWPGWLAASIAQEQELYARTGLNRRDRVTRDVLVQWLVQLVETAGALLPPERAHCGRVLGLLGDPRPGVGLSANIPAKGIPEIAWGEPVLPGDYPVGGDKEAFQSLPAGKVKLNYEFRLGKYPITNAQFQAFVDADSEGYNDPAFWTPAGLEWKGDRRAPEDAGEGAFGLPNHPRVNVCWYEVLAFCRWLSVRYRALGLLEDHEEISLPTQVEWEIGARGKAGLLFPYDNAFDASRGNVWETKIGQTSAVGLFPSGASPYGVLDMNGNVLEWCLTAFESGSNEASGSASRVVRGGSWDSDDRSARACARDRRDPSGWSDARGFRVVRLPNSINRS
jgi:formylglycine-generating enzyme required for sulfatase activity